MGELNLASVRAKIGSMTSKKFEDKMATFVQAKFDEEKQKMLEDYATDKVTTAIAMGPDGSDAGLLNGKGSLYGFIGFDADEEEPTKELGEYLDKSVRIKNRSKTPGKLEYKITVTTPDSDDLRKNLSATPEWMGDTDWASKVEDGIEGLESFVYFGNLDNSLSKAGVQARNELRGDAMQPTPYLSKILGNFVDRIKTSFRKK